MLRDWWWSVLLCDGTQALSGGGQWELALAHARAHRGIGRRLLEGRQVAVLAALADGDPATARALLHRATPTQPWEHAVAAVLGALCEASRTGVGDPATVVAMARRLGELEPDPARGMFRIRLANAIVELARAIR